MIDYIDFIKIIKVLLICFIADYSLAQNNNPLDTNSAREYIYNLYGVDILELDHPGYVNVWLSQCGFLRPYNWFEIPLDNDFCILNFYLRGEKINTNQCVFWAIPVNFTDSCLILHSDSDKIFFPNDIEGIYAIYMEYNGYFFHIGDNSFHEWRKLFWMYFVYDRKPFFEDFHKYDLIDDYIPRANTLTYIPFSEMKGDSSIVACVIIDYVYNFYKTTCESFSRTHKSGITNEDAYFINNKNAVYHCVVRD